MLMIITMNRIIKTDNKIKIMTYQALYYILRMHRKNIKIQDFCLIVVKMVILKSMAIIISLAIKTINLINLILVIATILIMTNLFSVNIIRIEMTLHSLQEIPLRKVFRRNFKSIQKQH